MALSYSTNAKLRVPPFDWLDWNTPLNENWLLLDSTPAIGDLRVTTTEVPSAGLTVTVAAGDYRKRDGTVATYAGIASQAVSNNATTVLYLDSSGALQTASTYPTGSVIVRLATVVATSGVITSIDDDRSVISQPYVQTSGSSQVALTDSTTGTPGNTISDVGSSFSQSTLNNNLASLAAKINMLRSELVAHGLIKGSA